MPHSSLKARVYFVIAYLYIYTFEMTALEKRKQVSAFLKNNADEQLVNMVYGLIQGYIASYDADYDLSDEEIRILDKEQKLFKSGKSKGYSFDELKKTVHQRINK